MLEVWTYRTAVAIEPAVDLTDFKVEARDGSVGTVEDSTTDAGKSYIVLDTGSWIFGKKVVLPASTIEKIDIDNRVVVVDRTKEQIKNAPEFDPDRGVDDRYRDELTSYYGSSTVR